MSTDHFVVSQRDSAWQFSFKGDVTAPFTSRSAAIEAAIAAAGKVEGAEVAVVLRDGDRRSETIWRSNQTDLTESEAEQLAADIERDSDA
ncbi:DUF2188 domain-containing protein [Devosia ginsengisoli]|uniref:DUF2188 domain-containing protein n=1 Tax=Devosia ginsengisoli TaxID=400770 RepID=UPI0026F1ED0B|nr:DUF2188 domain-containing protein [Devosia ginsengisoli]MCR6672846.1 DUF2188 domain-containing protein [Devosia ginsengisoli]